MSIEGDGRHNQASVDRECGPTKRTERGAASRVFYVCPKDRGIKWHRSLGCMGQRKRRLSSIDDGMGSDQRRWKSWGYPFDGWGSSLDPGTWMVPCPSCCTVVHLQTGILAALRQPSASKLGVWRGASAGHRNSAVGHRRDLAGGELARAV